MLDLGSPDGNAGRLEAIRRFLSRYQGDGMFNPEAQIDTSQVQKQPQIAPEVTLGQDRPPLYSHIPGFEFVLGENWDNPDAYIHEDDYPDPYQPPEGGFDGQGVGVAPQTTMEPKNLLQQLISLLSGGR